jgi:hypothetical protein
MLPIIYLRFVGQPLIASNWVPKITLIKKSKTIKLVICSIYTFVDLGQHLYVLMRVCNVPCCLYT